MIKKYNNISNKTVKRKVDVKYCSSEGITLVALVVTIIVLLILAGIAINLTIGENGIIKRSEKSVEEHNKSAIQEEIQMAIFQIQLDKKNEKLDNESIIKNLANQLEAPIEIQEDLSGSYKGYDYYIDENYVVHIGNKSNNKIKMSFTKKVGTSYISISVDATSTEGNIEKYKYIIDGETIEQTGNTLKKDKLEPESSHVLQIVAIDEKQNEKVSGLIYFTTEPRTYLYNEGEFNPLMDSVVDGGHFGNNSGSLDTTPDYFTVGNNNYGNAHYARSNNLIDFTEFAKLCCKYDVGLAVSPGPWCSIFLSTLTSYRGVDNPRGNVGMHTEYLYKSSTELAEIDIEEFDDSAYIFFRHTHRGNTKFSSVWLEK